MDTLTNIAKEVLQGAFDSISGITVVCYLDREVNRKFQSQTSEFSDIELIKQRLSSSGSSSTGRDGSPKIKEDIQRQEPSNVLKRVLECCALNGGIFWLSIIFFEYCLLPGVSWTLDMIFDRESGTSSIIWSWMQPVLSILFGMVWVMPLFILSRIVNSLWFQDIADSAYKFRKGRPQPIPNISKFIADTLFSLMVQILFLIQSMVVRVLPINYIGCLLCFVHMCLLYSLYSFEYKWCNMGWELHKRLTYIEYNWPYFLGFGMPLAVLTQLPNSYIVSGCVFSILFPFFILSGNEAIPVTNASEIPLKLFSPVVAISNALFSKSVVKKPSTRLSSSPATAKPSVSASANQQSFESATSLFKASSVHHQSYNRKSFPSSGQSYSQRNSVR